MTNSESSENKILALNSLFVFFYNSFYYLKEKNPKPTGLEGIR